MPPQESDVAGPTQWSQVSPLRQHRLSERVLQQLQDMILRGELKAGDQLPPERELAEIFGVGRNSVREAVRQLAMLGMVEAYQGGGTFVQQATALTLSRPFRNVIALTPGGPQFIIEFRKIVEPGAAALAAARVTPTELAEIESTHKRFERAMEGRGKGPSHEDPAQVDTEFHHLIAKATGNPVLAAVEEALLDLLYSFRLKALSAASYDPHEGPAEGHRRILDAIAKGDPAGASAAATEHLLVVEAYVKAEATAG